MHLAAVQSVAFSPDCKHIASGSGDKRIVISDLDGHEVAVLEGHSGPVTGISYCPDGETLASASDDCSARIWDLNQLISTKTRAQSAQQVMATSQSQELRAERLREMIPRPVLGSETVGPVSSNEAKARKRFEEVFDSLAVQTLKYGLSLRGIEKLYARVKSLFDQGHFNGCEWKEFPNNTVLECVTRFEDLTTQHVVYM